MPIHSRFIHYYNEVSKLGSIRKAADILHVSYSAVSRQITKVENELDITLFERETSGMKPTRAGELLQQHVDRTLHDEHRTIHEINQLDKSANNRITIISQESVIERFLPPVLTSLYSQYPDIAVEIKTAGGKRLIQQLQNHDADIAIAFDPDQAPDIKVINSQDLYIGAVVSTAHALASKDKVTLRECLDFPLVLPNQTWSLRDILDQQTMALDISPNISYSSDSVAFMRTMLENEQFVGFLTVIGIETKLERGNLAHIPLYCDELITQKLKLCTRKNALASQAFQYLINLLVERMERYSENVLKKIPLE